MLEFIGWGVVVFAPPIVAVAAILLVSRIWRRYERRILAFGVLLSIITLFSGCFATVSIGGDDARLIVRNESSWPIEVTAEQPAGIRVVAPGDSAELVGYGGPGWANGLVIKPEIRGGPDRSVFLSLLGLTGEELTVVISNNGTTVIRSGGGQ